jgi:hypothetical protein
MPARLLETDLSDAVDLSLGDLAAFLGTFAPRPAGAPGRLFWALPILTTGEGTVAVRLLPGRAVADSPVVLIHKSNAITVASRAAGCLPMLLLRFALADQADNWKAWRESWDVIQSDLTTLDDALGGVGLESLRSVVFDPHLGDALARAQVLSVEASRVVGEAMMRIDPSPEHVGFRQLLQTLIETKAPPPLAEVARCGVWSQLAAMLAYHAARDAAGPDVRRSWSWAVHERARGVDYRGPRPASHVPTAGVAILGAKQTAKDLQAADGPWRQDPRASGFARVAAEGEGYDGREHMLAAQALAGQGRGEDAWDVLCDAAFYAATSGSTDSSRAIAAEAEALATAQGWDILARHAAAVRAQL